MKRTIWLSALVLLVLPACKSTEIGSGTPVAPADNVAQRIDRGDWMVSEGSRVWKVMAAAKANRPPEHIGFLEERRYRQRRGGPVFTMYSVTTRNRKEQVGHIDQMGRAYRYEPVRNGTFRKVALGTNTKEMNVQAIFDMTDDSQDDSIVFQLPDAVGETRTDRIARVTLLPTTERRLAFEALDTNGDGVLQPDETRSFGDRISGADANRDGFVDFEEFDAVDVL